VVVDEPTLRVTLKVLSKGMLSTTDGAPQFAVAKAARSTVAPEIRPAGSDLFEHDPL